MTSAAPRCTLGPALQLLFTLVLISTGVHHTAAAYGAGLSFFTSAGASASSVTSASAPKVANLTGCPNLRIGIINGVPYHYEVLAGLMHTFRPYARRTDIYVNPYTRTSSGDGAWEVLRRSRVNYIFLTRNILKNIAQQKPFYDLLILVSPDYELDANEELLRHIRRHMTVAIVHNSDFNETERLIRVAEGGSSGARLVTLSPHTATSLASATGRQVDWVLPVYPFKPKTNCLDASEVDLLGMCLRGFAIQGKFSSLRRNYSAVWHQMSSRREELTTGYAKTLFHINVMGKGQDDRLGLPDDLVPFVTVLRRLPFRGFYDHLHHSFAILPMLGNRRYLTHKFSSSILSSFISGTPLVANREFLASYSMLNERCVYLQKDDEQELDVMLRLVATPATELLAVRRQMAETRRRVNERAALGPIVRAPTGRLRAAVSYFKVPSLWHGPACWEGYGAEDRLRARVFEYNVVRCDDAACNMTAAVKLFFIANPRHPTIHSRSPLSSQVRPASGIRVLSSTPKLWPSLAGETAKAAHDGLKSVLDVTSK
ncbi:hypothetical protein VOLCADRAFT_85968 [Volvox carteri f. nagariensis]|uniref:Uncharacterized protein n=1 Tax=Volvox carteri f. nagariensis TaxID=3068 RepID=D8THG7_VOLCA|nr:uncharacterized protein VOLCADRAFT_85968 [Volvox carteri f. nagariensis]EFJ52708.1 hypothetical protein VOLCADRAFT_85968 [Volvox carteri f. nagariensis]|eukprot:XP_002945713.1 hypothetical protein VOLCADRAFT_85968 [Volvox carteri f. nagariensis]